MLSKKEIASMLAVVLILGFSVSFLRPWNIFLKSIEIMFIILLLNLIAKKITAYYLDSEIEAKIWQVSRYGFKPSRRFRRPFPAGLFLPAVLSILSFGKAYWLSSAVFEVKPKIYRAAKRHGLYAFSEMTEWHIGLIAAAGIITNLVAAVIAYFAGYPDFSRLSIYYVFFNMLPLSDLDGNKIIFGSIILWSFLAIITAIALGYAFLLV